MQKHDVKEAAALFSADHELANDHLIDYVTLLADKSKAELGIHPHNFSGERIFDEIIDVAKQLRNAGMPWGYNFTEENEGKAEARSAIQPAGFDKKTPQRLAHDFCNVKRLKYEFGQFKALKRKLETLRRKTDGRDPYDPALLSEFCDLLERLEYMEYFIELMGWALRGAIIEEAEARGLI